MTDCTHLLAPRPLNISLLCMRPTVCGNRHNKHKQRGGQDVAVPSKYQSNMDPGDIQPAAAEFDAGGGDAHRPLPVGRRDRRYRGHFVFLRVSRHAFLTLIFMLPPLPYTAGFNQNIIQAFMILLAPLPYTERMRQGRSEKNERHNFYIYTVYID